MAVLTQLERRGHARQTAPDCSRLRAKTWRRQTHRRGSPTLDTEAAGWEAQEPPGSGRNCLALDPHPRLLSRAGHGALMPEGAEGSRESRGRGYLAAGGRNTSVESAGTASVQPCASALLGVRAVGSRERSRPGGRGSGARGDGSGHGESRAEAETLPGAPDWGGGGYGAGVGGRLPSLRHAPARPPANHQSGAGSQAQVRPSLLSRPREGRVLKETFPAEG